MVWAISLGIFLFGEWPDKLTMLGTAMIILTGIYSFHREQIRQRAETLNQ
jgi:S-adenosylmethionine uptake transporter